MKILVSIILVVTAWTLPAWAQDDDIGTATGALQNVLVNLKQSVEKLSLDNDQLSTQENTMRSRVAQLQSQLGALQAQGEVLDRSVVELKGNSPRRAQEITRLEDENYQLDDQIQKDEVGIKSIQQTLEPAYQENQRLLVQLKGMGNALSVSPQPGAPVEQADDHAQKEKLKLMKMIYDSQERQEKLHEAIMNYQKDAPLRPADTALAQQEVLKVQIKELQATIDALPPDKPAEDGFADQWDDRQMRQLQDELKVLERNYVQLKALMEQMTRKAQQIKPTVSEHVEEEKLQGNLEQLNRQAISLRVDLDELRAQMVDLDKRKSHLEDMIKNLS